MLDIETLGTRPGAIILSCALVRFSDEASVTLNLSLPDQEALATGKRPRHAPLVGRAGSGAPWCMDCCDKQRAAARRCFTIPLSMDRMGRSGRAADLVPWRDIRRAAARRGVPPRGHTMSLEVLERAMHADALQPRRHLEQGLCRPAAAHSAQ